MTRRSHRGLLVGISFIALAAIGLPASAQNLVNPSGTTVPPGFIKVDPGETFDNVFNFGTITGNGALGAGIEVEGNGAVLFDVRNRGTGIIRITGQTGTGIHVYGSGASVGDDVDNFGLIQVDATEFAYGIHVEGTNQFVGGDIANRGEGVMLVSAASTDSETGTTAATATATDASAVGIWVTQDVTGIDDIANYGVMRVEAVISANAVASGTNFAQASASLVSDADAWGMYIDVTSIQGAIINAGRLEVDAVAHAAAIAAATGPGAAVSVNQDSATASARAVGIEAAVTTISGGFGNVGVIDVDARAEVIDHGVANATTGDATAQMDVADSITRYADADATGVYVYGFSSLGGVLNLGSIDAQADALVDIELTANARTGVARAYIDATDGIYISAYAEAYGLYITGDTITTGVLNAGDVAAIASAVVDIDIAAIAAGGATAYIRDDSSTIQFYASATASGVYFDVVGIDGDFVNAGDIDAHAIATIDVAVGAEGGVGDAIAYISASDSYMSATADASAIGLYVSVTNAAGDVRNSGDIDVLADAGVVLGVAASETDGGASARIHSYYSMNFIASASATGASFTITTAFGDVENSGRVIAIANAAVELDVSAHAGNGDATAYVSTTDTSLEMTASATAQGILIDIVDARGDVVNTGFVGVGADATIDVSIVADADGGDALAYFAATASTINLSASAQATGISVSITSIDGDIRNSGDADVVAHAAIVVGVSAYAVDGDASAYITGSRVSFSATATAFGLYVTISEAGGDIANSGDLTVTAAGVIDVAVEAHSTDGDATAYFEGTAASVNFQASGSAYGIFIEADNVGGSIVNSGNLDVAAVALVGANVAADGRDGGAQAWISAASAGGNITISAVATAYGIKATVTTTISGGFTNSGDIGVLAHAGVVLDVSADAGNGAATAYIFGYTGITIGASAQATGILATVDTIDGTFGNSGDVTAVAQADVAIDVAAHAVDGGASAFLSTTGTTLSIEATASAYGIVVDVETLGSFTNSGAVAAQAIASVDIGISAESDDGAKAVVRATDSNVELSANAVATGLSVSVTTVNGDVRNTGAVDVLASAAVIVDIAAHAGTGGEASAYLSASVISPTISATAVGAVLSFTTVHGSVVNSGDITVTAAALLDVDVIADGGENAFASIYADAGRLSIDLSATATGLDIDASLVDGDVTNSGDVQANALAHIDLAASAYASGSAIGRIAADNGYITISATGDVVALSINLDTVANVLNSGAVEAHGSALVNLAAIAHGVTGDAEAYISASTRISISATMDVTGLSAVITLVEGNLTNSGDVTATANAVVDIGIRADTGSGTADAYLSSTNGNLYLSANGYAVGITLSVDTVEGDVSNSGDVDVLAHAGVVVGITAIAESGPTATASAFLFANAALTLNVTATAYGVVHDIDTVDGDVTNSGDITVAALADVEVGIRADSDSDDAYAAVTGNADIGFDATAYAFGIVLAGSTAYVGGDVVNSGDIAVLANAGIVVALEADSLVGDARAQITAQSSLSIYAHASAYGIVSHLVDVEGDFTNSGDVLAGALAEISVTLTATAADGTAFAFISSEDEEIHISAEATAYGIAIGSDMTTLAGDFRNSGDVDAVAQAGVVVSLFADANDDFGDNATAYISASVDIEITADARAIGLSLDVDTVGGAVVNSGAVSGHAIATIDVALTADGGEGNALAYISADDSLDISASADAKGLTLTAVTVDGGVNNSGAIEAIANAAVVVSLSADAPNGQAQAYIVVTDFTLSINASASATGIDIDVDTLNGDVANSGDVHAAALATVDVSLFADGGESSALAYIDATDTGLSITADAEAQGITVSITNLNGSFDNLGDVAAIANAAVVVSLTAYASGAGAVAYITAVGSDLSISASADATGIDVNITAATGNIGNAGDVTAAALATLDVALRAIATAGGEASAFIQGSDLSITVTASATGIDADIDQLGGSFTNSGDVEATAIGDLDMSLSAYAVDNNAFAHIDASDELSIGASAEARGINASMTNVGGDVVNHGDIEAAASANAGVILNAGAEGGSAFAYLSAATDYVSLTAYASAYGIEADVGTLDNLTNSGDIVVDAVARVGFQASAYASGTGFDANAYINAASGSVYLLAHATAFGVYGAVDTVNGGIDNSGAIDVAAVAGVAVTMYASATGGDAHAYIFGTARVGVSASATAYGLLIDSTSIAGAVDNSGDITVDAQATLALDIEADPPGSAQAYISTTGELSLLANASAYGIEFQVGTIGGAVDNSGGLDVSAIARIDVTLDAHAGVGSGKAFLLGSGTFSITAAAYAFGIEIDDGAYGTVTNSGDMDVDAGAAVVLDLHADAASGSTASAFLNDTAGAVKIYAYADVEGMQVSPTTVGSLDNSGDLDVGAQALLQITLHADASSGSAVAYIYGNGQVDLGALAFAHGIFSDVTALGPVSNSGDITANARADVDIALMAHGSTEDAHIAASSSLSIYAVASAYGIEHEFTTMNGGFANSGDITSVAVATLNLELDAFTQATISATNVDIFVDAHAYGVSLNVGVGNINGDVTNDADIVARAFASSYVSGVSGGTTHTAYALGVAFHIGTSGTLNGDFVNDGLLAAVATAYANGTGNRIAIATAIGLDIRANVTGNVINDGTIVGSAYADSAYAYGIVVEGHAIGGSIQNTGIIAAFAEGDSFEEAFSIQLRGATGPTTIEQLDGFIIGDINLDNTVDQADTIEFSGGEIRGGIFGDGPAGGDELVAFRGVDATLNITGDIDGLQSINVNPLGFSSSSLADVELRIGGDVTNTGNLNVNTHGTLVVGLFSDITVTNYRQVPTGTTLFEINAGGENGTIYPDNVVLAGTVGIRPAPGLYADNTTYVVIDSPNLIGSTYDNVRSSALLHVEDDYSTPTEVHLNVTRIAFDAVGGLTHNQNAVGGALEADYGDIDPNSDFGAVVGSLFGLSQGEYQDALDDLAGAEHAQMLKIGAGAIQSIDNALMGRLAFVRGLSAEQMASVDGVGMAFAQVASTGDVDLHMDLAQAEAQQVANPGSSGIWARVFGGTSTLDGDDEAPGFDTDNGGVSVGIDHRLSPDAIVGLYGGYAHADASFDTDADGSVDTYQVGVYGSWASGGLHVDGMVSGAWQSYELKRSIDFLGRRASSDYDGWAIGASAQVGYDIALGSAAVIEPMAGLDYIHLETDGFSEDGADSVDLNVESGEFDSLRSSLGVRITAQIDAGDGITIIPTASVAWEHEFLDAKGEFTASFDGSPNGTTFDIIGSDDEADAAAISLGLALTSDNMTAFVGYDGKISGDSSAHQGTIGIRFGF